MLAGAADRGDFDPTSSTIALTPGGLHGSQPGSLPDALVRNTFDRYWRDFVNRRADDAAGIRHGDGAYTPYEWRIVGSFVRLGQRLRGRAIQHVNSTAVGGGVAEILSRLVPLTRELGIDVRWDVLRGGEAFFALTKRLHNGLQVRDPPL